jgi:hypothetical protein
VFSNKTVAFALGIVTFLAMLVFVKGLVRVVAEGHPGSAPATALDTLLD